MEHFRQGDVLIRKVDDLPKDVVKMATSEYDGKQRHVLAEGEATGHAHAVYLDTPDLEVTEEDKEMAAELFRTDEGQLYLKVNESTTVDHEEHDSIALEPGVYEVSGQREYDQELRERRVLD